MKILGIFESQGSVDWGETSVDIRMAWLAYSSAGSQGYCTPTRHFGDTSIACRSLGVNPLDLMNEFESFSLFFEDFAVRDLRVYVEGLGGEVKHYRDNSGLECDAVVTWRMVAGAE